MHPKGSGYYAVIVGILFLLAVAVSFFTGDQDEFKLWLIRSWLVFVASGLLYWGGNRVKTGSAGWTVGQETINMANGLFGTTIALLALLFGK
jgi:hypothetical protein